MSQFIMVGEDMINTQFIKEITFIENEEGGSFKFSLVGEGDPIRYQNLPNKEMYNNSKTRLIQELDVVIL